MEKERSFYCTPDLYNRDGFYIKSIGKDIWNPHNTLMRHGWDCHQLVYTISGAAVGTVNGQQIHANQYTAWILHKDSTYSYTWNAKVRKWSHIWIEFDGPWSQALLQMMNIHGVFCFQDARNIETLVTDVEDIIYRHGNNGQHEGTALLIHIFSRLEQTLYNIRDDGKNQLTLDQKAKRFMNKNLSENIHLADIARHCQITEPYLSRVFKDANGLSPMKYLRQLRVSRAKTLFRTSSLNISEVGRAVGYPVLQHFSRMFKQDAGITPREFVLSTH